MSAFLVDDEHINVVLYAGLRPLGDDGPLTWAWPDSRAGFLQAELTHDTATRVGQMLLDENIRSLGDGHPSAAVPVYHYEAPRFTNWRDTEILMAIHCYQYQACEPLDWRDTEACRFTEALETRIIRHLPGYQEAVDVAWPVTMSARPLGAVARKGLKLVK